MLDEHDVIERLRVAVDQAGGQRAFARSIGVTAAYVNDMLRGRRSVGAKVLDALGIERVVTHRVEYRDRAGSGE